MKAGEEALIEHVEDVLNDIIYERHDCGFYDGGCLIFASAVSNALKREDVDASIISIGRRNIKDHFAVMVKTLGGVKYIDAEGIYSEEALRTKIDNELLWVARHTNYTIEILAWNGDTEDAGEALYDKDTINEIEEKFNVECLLFLKDNAIGNSERIDTVLSKDDDSDLHMGQTIKP